MLFRSYKADLIMLDIGGVNMHPVHNLLNNIVYSSNTGNIEMTIVDGKVLYEKGEYKTLDVEKIIYQVDKATTKILEALR